MLISFYGVRGSIAAPGPSTTKYGGNTSCVHARLNSCEKLIFDAGTGIRRLGVEMIKNEEPLLLLLSHGHWDHIQGYPFFDPICQITVCQGPEGNAVALKALLEQMDGSNFPVQAMDLPSTIATIDEVESYLSERTFQAIRKDLNQPGGGHAYRIKEDGVTVAYITDNERDPPYTAQTTYDEWVEFCSGVDLLIHDAQYDENDMPAKHGWGHSLISLVRKLAVYTQVKNLVMYHHDPERTDGQLDEMAIESAQFFKSNNSKIGSYIAAEGLTFDLTQKKDPLVSAVNLFEF